MKLVTLLLLVASLQSGQATTPLVFTTGTATNSWLVMTRGEKILSLSPDSRLLTIYGKDGGKQAAIYFGKDVVTFSGDLPLDEATKQLVKGIQEAAKSTGFCK